MIKISIIIPVYNAQNTLKKLLESILSQTYSNYEVIIVDDGSTDKSFEIMKNIANQNTKIKIFSKKNEGPGLTRKFGYNKATGDLMFFLDSDDVLYDENVLSKIVHIYIENKFDILFFNFISINNGKNIISNALRNKISKEGAYNIKKLENLEMGGALWEKIFLTSKMKEEFFYDSNNYEDYYTTYMYLNDCKNFYYTTEIMYISNRDNPKSLSKTTNFAKKMNTIDIIEKIYEKSKLINSVKILAFNEYVNNYKLFYKCFNLTEDEFRLIEALKKVRKNIINNMYFCNIKKLKFKSIVKYYLLNIGIFIGERVKENEFKKYN